MPVASPESVVRASASPMLDPIPMKFDSESVAAPTPPAGARSRSPLLIEKQPKKPRAAPSVRASCRGRWMRWVGSGMRRRAPYDATIDALLRILHQATLAVACKTAPEQQRDPLRCG